MKSNAYSTSRVGQINKTALAEVTPWFPADVKPARKGIYERLCPGGIRYGYWTGKHWGLTLRDNELAYFSRRHASFNQSREWRGLASNPAKAK